MLRQEEGATLVFDGCWAVLKWACNCEQLPDQGGAHLEVGVHGLD